jgi:hypothetical protein
VTEPHLNEIKFYKIGPKRNLIKEVLKNESDKDGTKRVFFLENDHLENWIFSLEISF